MTSKIKLPELSSLAYDYYYNYVKVSQFYNGNFRNLSNFQNQAEKVKSSTFQRKKLAAFLEEHNRNFGCGSKTLGNINDLKQDQTCAVVTGQQVGLFSGPLYTIYKSLTAIKLAEYLNQNGRGAQVNEYLSNKKYEALAQVIKPISHPFIDEALIAEIKQTIIN